VLRLPNMQGSAENFRSEVKKMPTAYYNQTDMVDTEKALAFVEHIQKHLKPGDKIICTICGKTIDEIYEEMCEAEEASE